jgi:mRNA-degrading endonuclease RelE of RelBE toxin-antitoxin system
MLQTMAEYQVLLSRKAQSYYKRVDADTVQSLQDCFVALEQEPTDWQHPHIKRLRGRLSGLCRYQAGGTRVSFIALTRMPVWLMWWTLGPAEISTNQVTRYLLAPTQAPTPRNDFGGAYFMGARGSLEETRYHLLLARDLQLLDTEIYAELETGYRIASKMLNGLIQSLRRKEDTRIMDHGVGIRLSRMKAVLCARF